MGLIETNILVYKIECKFEIIWCKKDNNFSPKGSTRVCLVIIVLE